MSAPGGSGGTLYVVATPIGNLEDVSPRAARVLAESDLVVAEDTRRTQKLLAHLGLSSKPLRRIDAHAGERAIVAVVDTLAEGKTIAVCTDAGTPGVSDPGAALVVAARARGLPVVPIPGPSAVTAALSASGYTFTSFQFAGFLPRAGIDRTRAVAALASFSGAVVLFESPQRTGATLRDLASAMPGRRGAIARELTKMHEEIVEDALAALADRFAEREVAGEVTIVLAPWEPATVVASDEEVEAKIAAALAEGLRAKDAAERVALETGRRRRDVYERITKRGGR